MDYSLTYPDRIIDEDDKRYSEKSLFWRGKRLFDVTVSALFLVLFIWFYAIVALIIYIDDPSGSPLYAQTRIGRHGIPFTLYKFRTMRVGADKEVEKFLEFNESDGPVFKIKNDPRITRVGKILRKTSIDELPQMYNVLIGDMSFVGPRPPLPREVELYGDFERQRLAVAQGLTCYWQIQPNRNDIPFRDWVRLDIKYINERCWSLDLYLIFKTIGAMLRCSGE